MVIGTNKQRPAFSGVGSMLCCFFAPIVDEWKCRETNLVAAGGVVVVVTVRIWVMLQGLRFLLGAK